MEELLKAIYQRILRNCVFYETEGKEKELLNEIGALRGAAYCLEAVGCFSHDDLFNHFIEKQNELLRGL